MSEDECSIYHGLLEEHLSHISDGKLFDVGCDICNDRIEEGRCLRCGGKLKDVEYRVCSNCRGDIND